MIVDVAPSPAGEAIDPRALDRFREIAAQRNAASGAVSDVARRRCDTIVHLTGRRMERDRVAAVRHHYSRDREEQAAEVAALDAEIATIKASHDRLATEEEMLQGRLNEINNLYCRCRDYLISTHGFTRKDLEN